MRGITIFLMCFLLLIWSLNFMLGCHLILQEWKIIKTIGIFTCMFSAYQIFDTIRIYITRKP